MRWEHSGGGAPSGQRAAAGAGPWARRCLLPPADLGTQPMSASLPGFWSWSQTRGPGSILQTVRGALHLLLVTTATSRQHQRHRFAKATRPALVSGTPTATPPRRPGAARLTGRWKRSRRQPSGAVGTLRWLQGEQQHAVLLPTQTPALPDLPGANIILPGQHHPS